MQPTLHAFWILALAACGTETLEMDGPEPAEEMKELEQQLQEGDMEDAAEEWREVRAALSANDRGAFSAALADVLDDLEHDLERAAGKADKMAGGTADELAQRLDVLRDQLDRLPEDAPTSWSQTAQKLEAEAREIRQALDAALLDDAPQEK